MLAPPHIAIRTNAVSFAAKTITTDVGEFECQSVKGGYKFEQGPTVFDIKVESHFADSDESAFGVVEYKLEFIIGPGLNGSAHFKLKVVGTNAESMIDHTKVN